MSDARARTTPLAPGQVWRHVGREGVPATGLRVRILRPSESRYGGWVIDYPDHESKGERRYEDGFQTVYALETTG